MATIIDDVSFSEGMAVESSAIENVVGYVRIQVEISGATKPAGTYYRAVVSYLVNDGTDDVELVDSNGKPITHEMLGNTSISREFHVNTASLKVVVTPETDHDGDVSAYSYV